jgi:signal peptidase
VERMNGASRRRWARTIVSVPMWILMGTGVTLLIAITALNLFGHRSLVVMSGSMQPVLRPGDLVIDQRITPLQARVGDVVTFRDPSDGSRLLTHRVRSIQVSGDSVTIVTKGDASNAVQRWVIRSDGTLGRVIFRVPKIGYPIFWFRSRTGVFAVLIVPSIILGIYLLIGIWRPARPEVLDASTP